MTLIQVTQANYLLQRQMMNIFKKRAFQGLNASTRKKQKLIGSVSGVRRDSQGNLIETTTNYYSSIFGRTYSETFEFEIYIKQR